jgi:FtsH-binding integral membrane protein
LKIEDFLISNLQSFQGNVMSKKVTKNQLLTRYALTGGALGLYFGFFFRPMRQPSLWFALLLAGLVMVVTVAVQAWQKRPLPITQLLKIALSTFLKAFLFLILLELRHPIYDAGGKAAVTVFMTFMGALAGLGYAYELIRQKRKL